MGCKAGMHARAFVLHEPPFFVQWWGRESRKIMANESAAVALVVAVGRSRTPSASDETLSGSCVVRVGVGGVGVEKGTGTHPGPQRLIATQIAPPVEKSR